MTPGIDAASGPVRLAVWLSAVVGALVSVTVAAVVFVPNLYAAVPAVLHVGSWAQDLVSVGLLPALWWSARAGSRGSRPGMVVWTGLLAYYVYAYALYVFGPQYSAVYLLYLPLLTCAVSALVLVAADIDVAALHARLHPRVPRWLFIVFFLATVCFLGSVWVAQMLSAIRSGTPSPFMSVHAVDLSLVFPSMVVAAIGLIRERAWGYALAGPLVVMGAGMTSSLVIAEGLALRRGTPDPWPITLAFVVAAIASITLTVRTLRAVA